MSRGKAVAAGGYVLAALAVGLVVVLGRQLQSVSDRYDALRERLLWPHPGAELPTFRARALKGDSVTVGRTSDGGRQLLFVFTTTCPYCRASLPAVERLHTHLESSPELRTSLVGITLDSFPETREYARSHGLSFPVVGFPEEKLEHLYRTGSVPLIVLTDGSGTVLYSRVGVLDGPGAIDSLRAAIRSPTGRPEAPADPITSNRGGLR